MMISVIGKRSFSLLELLVAVSILSLGMVAALQALSASGRIAALSCDSLNAVFLAEDIAQQLESKEKQGSINQESTQAKDKTGKFNWQYAMNPQPDLNLYRLDLNINWEEAGRQEGLNFNTYLRR